MIDRHILITNLGWVTVNGLRTFTHALLLTEGESFFDRKQRRFQLRGFGVDPAQPTFDTDIPSLNYTLTDAQSAAIFVSDSAPEGRSLMRGAIMQIIGGPRVDLVTDTSDQPLHFETFEGCITQVWAVLPQRVRQFWHAPNMPVLRWVSARG